MIPAVQRLTPSAGGGGKGSPPSPGIKKRIDYLALFLKSNEVYKAYTGVEL